MVLGVAYCPDFRKRWLDSLRGQPLTQEDRTCLELLAQGQATKEIARHLNLSREGTKNRIQVVLRKLDARNRTHAIALAYERGCLVRGTVDVGTDRNPKLPVPSEG